MMGLSTAKLFRAICWQNFDFPAPGEPTNRSRLLGGTSCIWVRETNNYPIYKVANAGLFKLRLVSKQSLEFICKLSRACCFRDSSKTLALSVICH